MPKVKLHKGDTVRVITGSEKGKEGTVVKIYPRIHKIEVQGVSIVKIHKKPTQNQTEGTIIEREAAIDVSNVALVDPKAKKPAKGAKKPITKIGIRIEDGKRIRYAKKSDTVLK
jgi:large subunit ribosomal protein L24